MKLLVNILLLGVFHLNLTNGENNSNRLDNNQELGNQQVKENYCLKYKKCGECLPAEDQYCGWCSLESKCSLRSNCQDGLNDPLYWISYKTGKCATINNVIPHQLQRRTTKTLELIIDHLPQLKQDLVCAFKIDEKTLLTNATKKYNGVNCATPRTDLLPHIQPGKHHLTANLSVQTKNDNPLVSNNFTFFDCSTYSSCTRCVLSEFPCDWCIEAHRCTHDTAENCRNDILATGVGNIGQSNRSGPDFCPTIDATGDSNEILVAAGTSKAVKVKVHIIGQFIVQTRFTCQFNIEGRITSLNAQLLGDTIYCDSMQFQYRSQSPNLNATFAIVWGGSKPLDNPHNVHVVIYRCQDMSDNCGMCLTLPEKYNCGWCSSTNSCEIEQQCSKKTEAIINWLNRMDMHGCLNPEIDDFNPKYGPVSGGTQITIIGKHLNAGSIIQAYINDHLPCEILGTNSTQVLCLTSPAHGIIEGRLNIQFDNRAREFFDYNYKYVEDPVIDFVTSGLSGQMNILRGIPAGGIKINVTGKQFEYIQNPSMYVYYENKMFSSQCDVISNTEMLCNSPVIDADNTSFDPYEPKLLEYGFIMDNVVGVHNLSAKHKIYFELYPNPIFLKFEENVKYFKSEYLTINGKNLDRACEEADVLVLIGNHICNITSISRQQLICRPPSELFDMSNDTLSVIVKIGNSLKYDIGRLSFATSSSFTTP